MSRDTPPIACLNARVRRLSRNLTRRYDSALAAVGLKATQFLLLSQVQRHGPMPAAELARLIDIDASTLSRNLQPLLAAGLLGQEPGADARSRRVAITPTGRERQREAQRHWRGVQREIEALLGGARVRALHALLDDCLTQLHEGAGTEHET